MHLGSMLCFLPEHILVQIIDYLVPDWSQQHVTKSLADLASINRVNRKLHRLSLKRLWRVVEWPDTYAWRAVRPELCALIEVLSIDTKRPNRIGSTRGCNYSGTENHYERAEFVHKFANSNIIRYEWQDLKYFRPGCSYETEPAGITVFLHPKANQGITFKSISALPLQSERAVIYAAGFDSDLAALPKVFPFKLRMYGVSIDLVRDRGIAALPPGNHIKGLHDLLTQKTKDEQATKKAGEAAARADVTLRYTWTSSDTREYVTILRDFATQLSEIQEGMTKMDNFAVTFDLTLTSQHRFMTQRTEAVKAAILDIRAGVRMLQRKLGGTCGVSLVIVDYGGEELIRSARSSAADAV